MPVTPEEVLAHYGVPGMKWGRRKSDGTSAAVSSTKKASSAKEDVSKLSDAELRQRINRIQMEKQYKQLTAAEVNPGKKVVTDLLATTAKGLAVSYAQQYARKGIDQLIAQAANKK